MKIKLPYGYGYQTLDIDEAQYYKDAAGGLDVETLVSNVSCGAEQTGMEQTGADSLEIGGGGGDHDFERPWDPEGDVVSAAMAAPIGSPGLAELARSIRNAVVICSDHTRPVPSRVIIPRILSELRKNSPDIDITLLVATGMHRVPTRGELERKFGADILNSERIEIHDSKDMNSMRSIGVLPSGAELIINRAAADASLLVAEGFIEPHFFAGFSGGRKSVLPGICAYRTVLGNHCAEFIAHPSSRTGVLEGNPIHRDMLAARRLAKLSYIVNVVIDDKKRVVQAFAGDPEAAHIKGCEALTAMCRVAPRRLADIVITTNGGAPLDLNIYQAVKSMTAAEAAAAPGAVVVVLSECADGTGGESFYRMMRDCESPAELLSAIGRVPMDQTAEDQWQAQILARILAKHKVILVCNPGAREAAERMKLTTSDSVGAAFEAAMGIIGDKANGGDEIMKSPRITIIPDGVSVIVDRGE